jgi:hypothetical protein
MQVQDNLAADHSNLSKMASIYSPEVKNNIGMYQATTATTSLYQIPY